LTYILWPTSKPWYHVFASLSQLYFICIWDRIYKTSYDHLII